MSGRELRRGCRSLAGKAGSNPTAGMYVCLLCLLCVIRKRSLRRADHSSTGVLPSAVCRIVIVKSQPWGGPGPLEVVIPWRKKWTYVFLFYYRGFLARFIVTDGLLLLLLLIMPGSVDLLATSQSWKGKLTFWERRNQKLNQTTSTLFMSILVTSCLQQIFQISYTTSLARETRF